MCGIVAVLPRPGGRRPPRPHEVLAGLDAALGALGNLDALERAAVLLERVDAALGGVPGVRAFLENPHLLSEVPRRGEALEEAALRVEGLLEAGGVEPGRLERLNRLLVRVKDATWAIRRDRLRAAGAVTALGGAALGGAAVEAYTSIDTALSAIDRLEVRGRDSAGLHVLVAGHGLDLASAPIRSLLAGRADDPLFTSMAVRAAAGHLVFVYKAAAEIGELGDNVRALRRAIAGDELLRRALAGPGAWVNILGHTRWASVGIISEANAHPVNHEEAGAGGGPYVAGVLNGDVDNHRELRAAADLRIPFEITTDAKVIPALVSRSLAQGRPAEAAFLEVVAGLEGSVAVAACLASDPGRLHLAVRGSGQALYVGLAEDAFIVASEPYGLVEAADRYLRIDGESGSPPGQVVVLDAAHAGTLDGIGRRDYDGAALPVSTAELRRAEITTRDIDRRGFAHFLLKEISEAPGSVRKTLRGRLVPGPQGLHVSLGDEVLPPELLERLRQGAVRRIAVIGQGTAAVAGQSLALALTSLLGREGPAVEAVHATELSGFGLADDMSDLLVVAISQSGTTTDTNRTVDLVRSRGATVLGIVNRRNSDLVEKVHGVLYTSDGRDVEMAVPSTKAFYAQVVAGLLLAVALAHALGRPERQARDLLDGVRDLPRAMEELLSRRKEIERAAEVHAPGRRSWALVGSGPNRVAAHELRIKLSELCYKSVAVDTTEDKKHIDLSSEPLVLVCAAGLEGTTGDDVEKEIAIYRAHRAAPVVIASDDGPSFEAAVEVLRVPAAHPGVAFVLSAMAGHLFGYGAALAIDAQARPLREIRAAIETLAAVTDSAEALGRLRSLVEGPATAFLSMLRDGACNGHLDANVAVRLSTLLGLVRSESGLDTSWAERSEPLTPGTLIEELAEALTAAIDQLTRPVDAIKHQAKTVTVGTSRSEEALYRGPLVEAVLAAGTPRAFLGYGSLRALGALDGAVATVTGWTRYRLQGSSSERAEIHVVAKGGVAAAMPSRTEADPALRGTKHRAVALRAVLVARGGTDGRPVVIVPEIQAGTVVGLVLLHADFHGRLPHPQARRVLAGYLDRLDALVDAVTESQPAFRDEVLGEVPVLDLLTEPVHVLARRW
jgi:glucosamine--fructose-6-phosphate aminotransferase (isomerizing)